MPLALLPLPAVALLGLGGDALADGMMKRKVPTPGGAAQSNILRRGRELMGTTCEIVVAIPTGDDQGPAVEAIEAAFTEMARVEALMTTWRPDSSVSKLNARAGKGWTAIDLDTATVMEKSQWGAKLSGGAFDITVGTFKGLWKFDDDVDGSIPSDADVKARLSHLGWKKVQVRRNLAKKTASARITDPRTLVTLGGSAKGYAVDVAVATLRGRGFNDFIVQAGGDLYVAGDRGDRAWQVVIKDPRGGDPFASIQLRDSTFSTSGDYERFAIIEGRRYHHIMDLRTGWPATASQSATVLARTAVDAEVLTKTAFILGGAEGLALVERAGAKAVIVTAAGEVLWSPGLSRLAR